MPPVKLVTVADVSVVRVPEVVGVPEFWSIMYSYPIAPLVVFQDTYADVELTGPAVSPVGAVQPPVPASVEKGIATHGE